LSFKFKIDPAQVIKVEATILKAAQGIIDGQELKKEIGSVTVERIKYQTRLGKPLSKQFKKSLEPDTVANRRYLARYNSTHQAYKDTRSNLTLTGAFLDSLTYAIEPSGDVKIYFEGDHPGYKTKTGRTEGLPNTTLAGYLRDKGFVVFDSELQSNENFIKRLKSVCLAYIRRGLKVINRL
jgi:hypothetical protein